jgi:phenylacetate-coenzyme A ligase PaaK-like adenylate-forming protein
MDELFDALEGRDPAAREDSIRSLLPKQIQNAFMNAPAYRSRLRDVDLQTVTSREALARLPVIRKHELLEEQRRLRESDVFGGFSTMTLGRGDSNDRRPAKVFISPGPIYEPEALRADYWRMARALHAAGMRRGDVLHNSFSYHFTPAGSMFEAGAIHLGCPVFAAGTGQTEQQVEAIRDLRPDAYAGTPGFLRILLERADAIGIPCSSLRVASVAGEPFPTEMQSWFASRGVQAYQTYGTADLGLIAYETQAREGLVIDEGVIVEIVAPGGHDPIADGEVGEVVVTTLNSDYPLIRFATGDLSATMSGSCPTGRTNRRIRGWMGRADQSVKVRGLFVHPTQVAEVQRRYPQITRAKLIITAHASGDRMTLLVEADAPDLSSATVQQALRDVTKLRGDVEFVGRDSLAADGKVIEDRRATSLRS